MFKKTALFLRDGFPYSSYGAQASGHLKDLQKLNLKMFSGEVGNLTWSEVDLTVCHQLISISCVFKDESAVIQQAASMTENMGGTRMPAIKADKWVNFIR